MAQSPSPASALAGDDDARVDGGFTVSLENFDGPFDLLKHFGQKLPVIIIARMLGVPEDMSDDLLRWSNAMVRKRCGSKKRRISGESAPPGPPCSAMTGRPPCLPLSST